MCSALDLCVCARFGALFSCLLHSHLWLCRPVVCWGTSDRLASCVFCPLCLVGVSICYLLIWATVAPVSFEVFDVCCRCYSMLVIILNILVVCLSGIASALLFVRCCDVCIVVWEW